MTEPCPTCGHQRGGLGRCMCWYEDAIEEAHARFKPLIDHFNRAEIHSMVWQTGGMVMCLGINLVGSRYAMFSEFGEPAGETGNASWFCLYRDEDDEGTCLYNDDIPYVGENAESIVSWAAPIIVRFGMTGVLPTVDTRRGRGDH